MPRRRTYGPDTALTDTQHNVIETALHALAKRSMKFKRTEVTQDDILNMIVPPEHRGLAIDAVEILGVEPTYSTHLTIGTTQVSASPPGTGNFKFVAPSRDRRRRALNEGRQSTYYDEAAEAKVKSWLDWRIEKSRVWGTAFGLHQFMNEWCPDLATYRVYCPFVVQVVEAGNPWATTTIEQLRPYNLPKFLKPLPPEVRAVCEEVKHLIAMTMLLPETAEGYVNEVDLHLEPYNLPNRTLPWTGQNDIPSRGMPKI